MNYTSNFPIVNIGDMFEEAQTYQRSLLPERGMHAARPVWPRQHRPAFVLHNQPGPTPSVSLYALREDVQFHGGHSVLSVAQVAIDGR